MGFEFKKLTKEESIEEVVKQESIEEEIIDSQKAPMLGGETPIKNVKKLQPSTKASADANDLARLRQGRVRHEGFDIGQYVQSVPMLFTRDGHNMWLGDHYRGGHAFLILGGPSFGELLKESFEFKGKNRTTSEILDYPGHITMSVNNSVRTYRPNLWACVDSPSHFIKSIWLDPKIQKFVPFCHTEKTLFDNETWKETDIKVGDCPNVLYYRRNEHFQDKQFMHEDTFNWGNHKNHGGGRSVMLVAFRMLYYLGIRNVYLLGCDFNMDDDSKYHFEQDRTKGSQNGNMSTYSKLKKRFADLKPQLDELGYNVWNCNPDSKLDVFPHMSFIDAARKASANMPLIETERTVGLYDKDASEKKEKEAKFQKKLAEKVASKYSENDKKEIKEKLDKARAYLQEMKDKAAIEPTEENENNVKKARANFRKIEKEKNMIWGIVK